MASNADNTFIETQNYNNPRSKYIAIILSVFFTSGVVYTLFAPVHAVPADVGIGLFAGWCFIICVDIYVFFRSLYIRIDEQGIVLKEKPSKIEILCEWENIDQVLVRYYKHGILGIRSGAKNGLAFNLKAKAGIQIVFKNGEEIHLGIQNIENAKLVIEHYFKMENPGS